MRANPPRRNGFTLIELAIALVIIGLVTGAILVGRDLIRMAELRKTHGEVESFRLAVQTFKGKYGGLPGDLLNATAFFGTDPDGCDTFPAERPAKVETCNGNGNGFIEVDAPVLESLRFWQQLAGAQFIPGLYNGSMLGQNAPAVYGMPTVKWFTGDQSLLTAPLDDIDLNPSNDTSRFHILYMHDPEGTWTKHAFATAREAKAFDQKYDDGLPHTGTIRTLNRTHAPPSGCWITVSGETDYNPAESDARLCYLLFDALF